MSTKRKLQRRSKTPGSKARPAPKGSVSSVQRFRTPGSEKLWTALLGWTGARLVRAWLLDALHDAALSSAPGAAALDAFAARRPDLRDTLRQEELDVAVTLIRQAEGNTVAHWHYLAELVLRAGLGSPSADELHDDWRVWTSVAEASVSHKELLASLARAEQAAVALHKTTHSDHVLGVLTAVHGLWAALAHGDDASLAQVAELSRRLDASR